MLSHEDFKGLLSAIENKNAALKEKESMIAPQMHALMKERYQTFFQDVFHIAEVVNAYPEINYEFRLVVPHVIAGSTSVLLFKKEQTTSNDILITVTDVGTGIHLATYVQSQIGGFYRMNVNNNMEQVLYILETYNEKGRNDFLKCAYANLQHSIDFYYEEQHQKLDEMKKDIHDAYVESQTVYVAEMGESFEQIKKEFDALNERFREDMTEEEETEYIEKCFSLYEKCGFASTFFSPYSEYAVRNGQAFDVLGRCSTDSYDLECLPAWKIRFNDGTCMQAFPEEIALFERMSMQKPNVCRIRHDS